MRQRKLLLPPFHGEAVQRYVQMIAEVAEREIDRWPSATPFALAPRMQAVTLDVIMSGVFGIEGSRPGTIEDQLRETIRRLLGLDDAVLPAGRAAQRRPPEPQGSSRLLAIVDRQLYRGDRASAAPTGERGERTDILSLLLQARDEDGRAADRHELRDELLSLVWPATRRPPTRSPGRSSGCCARRRPTTGCASWRAPAAPRPRPTSRRRSTSGCATAR